MQEGSNVENNEVPQEANEEKSEQIVQEGSEVAGEESISVEELQKQIKTLQAQKSHWRKKAEGSSAKKPQYDEDRIDTMLDLRQKYPTLTGDTRKKVMKLMDQEGINSITDLEKDPILSPFLEKLQKEAREAGAIPSNNGRQGNPKRSRYDDLSFDEVSALSSEEYAEYKKYHGA